MNKIDKKIFYSLVVLVAIFIIWLVFFVGAKIYEVGGNISSINGNSIIIIGFFDLENSTDQEPSEIKIKLDNNVNIKRVALRIPQTKEMFAVDELPKEESEVSLDTLKQDYSNTLGAIGFIAKVKRSFLNPFDFKVVEAEYRLPIFEVPRD